MFLDLLKSKPQFKFSNPENIFFVTEDPDFRLVPKDEEESFCRWKEIRDYVR